MKKIFTSILVMLSFGAIQAQSTCSLSPIADVTVCYEIGCNTSAQASFFSICPPPYTYLWMPGGMTTQVVNGLCPGTYTVTASDQCNCSATQTFTIIQNPQLFLSTSQAPATCGACPDGSATANASGGTPPYIFMWNTNPMQNTQTATNLLPGNYTVTMVDVNGCTLTDTATVTFSTAVNPQPAPAPLAITLVQNPVSQQAVFEMNIPGKQSAQLLVYNALGMLVDKVAVPAQQQRFVYNSAALSPGMYFCKLTSGGSEKIIRMVVGR